MRTNDEQRAAAVAVRFGAPLPPVELSIEIFPPKSPEAAARLRDNLELFVAARPRFISVTCGAGGGAEDDGTFALVREVQERHAVPTAAHLTCASASRAEVEDLAARYWEAGVRRIVALRGDPPKGAAAYIPREDGHAYAADLVAALRRVAPFEVSVACYPEVHPEAGGALADLENLKRKVDAGAVRLISQYCFDTDRILRFRDALEVAGIDAEFVPGIMPIHNFTQVRRFSAACGAGIPGWLAELFEGVDEGSQLHAMLAASVAVEQCRRLAAEGVAGLHVYALNRAELPLALLRLLGVGPAAAGAGPTPVAAAA